MSLDRVTLDGGCKVTASPTADSRPMDPKDIDELVERLAEMGNAREKDRRLRADVSLTLHEMQHHLTAGLKCVHDLQRRLIEP